MNDFIGKIIFLKFEQVVGSQVERKSVKVVIVLVENLQKL